MPKTLSQQQDAIARWQRELELARRGRDEQRTLRAVQKLAELTADLEDYLIDALTAVRRVRKSLEEVSQD